MLSLSGCAFRDERTPPRLVILYVACTVNQAHLAPYSPDVRYTPNLAAFAAESRLFLRHVTECGQSGVDFATIFTGTPAYVHGIYDHPAVLDDRNVLIAECFAAAGYDTWFWSGHPMASVRLNYGQGVAADHVKYRERMFRQATKPYDERTLVRLTANDAGFARILARLRDDPSYRAFVQIAFTVSHEPYHQYATLEHVSSFLDRFPEASRGVTLEELERWLPFYEANRHALNWDFPRARAELDLSAADVGRLAAVLEVVYATSIHRLDEFFGRLVKKIEEHGLAPECAFSFTIDHGETLYRENALFPWTHGPELAPEILDVPWILRVPGLEPGGYDGLTRSIDVFPTLAGLSGLEIPPTVQGTNLAPVLRGERPVPRQLAFSHTTLWPEERILRFAEFERLHSVLPRRDAELMAVRIRDLDRAFKLCILPDGSSRYESFDLTRDPLETTNSFDPLNPEHERMAQELVRYKARLVEGFDPARASGLSESESLERLRALGYVR